MKRWVLCLLLLAACRAADDSRIRAVGTLEAVEVDLGPMTPARVVRVWVVRAGDTVATFSQPTAHPDIEQQRAALAVAQASVRDLVAGSRASEIARGEAELAAADAEATRALADYERAKPLAEHGTISRQALDAARSAADQATARREAARRALDLLREGSRPDRIAAARADAANARARLAAAEALAADLVLVAPVDGTVLSRNAEPGELLSPGQSAVTLGEVWRPWTRVYVSSLAAARVRVGQRAVATLDGMPDRHFAGRVVAINDRAEFTPRIALTERERADLLFGVKVRFDDSTGTLKPGLPVTVDILTDEPRP
jgi:HlyD family secretion protein